MAVTRAEVMHVAQLARLELTDGEVDRFTEQLNSILAHVGELEAVDLGDAAEVDTAAEWPAPLRADQPGPDRLIFPVSQLSQAFESGFFTVPRLAALDADATSTE
jgi:aspartyl-tRNA(Asn)/glutamyl-tRNA(Gln) amidotransferase subunit C